MYDRLVEFMETVIIVVHLMVVLALVGVVLLQRSEGGGLGIGGGSGFMTARGAANALTRATAILAVAFFATSLGLSLLARYGAQPIDILDRVPPAGQSEGGARPARRFRRSRGARDHAARFRRSDASGRRCRSGGCRLPLTPPPAIRPPMPRRAGGTRPAGRAAGSEPVSRAAGASRLRFAAFIPPRSVFL